MATKKKNNKKKKKKKKAPKIRAAIVEFMHMHCKGGGHEGTKKQRHKKERKDSKKELRQENAEQETQP